jgi:hypothetical protein
VHCANEWECSARANDLHSIIYLMKRFLAITALVILLVAQSDVCCAQWVHCGLANRSIPALAAVGSHIFASDSSDGGVYRSDDSGTTWVAANKGLMSTQISGFVSIGTTLFAVGQNKMFRSSDYGSTWDTLAGEVRWPVAALGSSLVWGDTADFFLSTDKGVSWVRRGPGLGQLTCMITKDTDIYAGSYLGGGDLWLSTDSGSRWTSLHVTGYGTEVFSVALGSTYLYVGTGPTPSDNSIGRGIFRTAPLMRGWEPLFASGLPQMPNTIISTIVSISTNSIDSATDNVILGTRGLGVFSSPDWGVGWHDANQGLTTDTVLQLLIVPPFIFAGSQGAGIWRRPLSDFGIESAVMPQTTTKREIQSYPNPFSQSTRITFSSQDEGYADVTVVNLLGTQVARIFSGELAPDEHSFSWDASGFAPGMYECIVRMNGQVQRVPMTLLR